MSRRRRTRQEEAEEEEQEEQEEEEEATDIKSNNPHLAGGEKTIFRSLKKCFSAKPDFIP